MKTGLSLMLCLSGLFLSSGLIAQQMNQGRDYQALTHSVQLRLLRGGVFEGEDAVEYIFQITPIAVLNSKEERLKKEPDRKTHQGEGETMGPFKVVALQSLTFEEGSKGAADATLLISGDRIRKTLVDGMRSFEAPESDVALRVKVNMLRRKRKYYFLTEDQDIDQMQYYPIPPSAFEGKEGENSKVNFEQKNGLKVEFAITYAAVES
jgi:hypothetical protein